jgi:PST family polysaccharide transporter
MSESQTTDLTRKSASGAAWVGSTGLASQPVALVTSVILARMLSPEDFGLVAMVSPIVVVLWMFLELGLSSATIQKKDLTEAESSCVFWANCGAALAAWAILSACSGLVAAFYGRPFLRALTVVYGLMVILGGLISQPRALLVRRMKFRALAAIELGSTLIGSALAVLAACRGWGPWAVAVLGLAPKAAQAAGFWVASRFRPLRPCWVPTARKIFAFGVNVSVYRLLDQVAANLDAVLIGRVWGAAPVGFYTRARRLTQNPLVLLHSYLAIPMVPALSRLQDEPRRLGMAYLRACRALAALTFPTACWLFVLAPEAVLLVYGKQWTACVPIFRVLCVVSLTEAAMRSLEWVYISSGRTDRLLRWTLIFVPTLCLGYAIGVRWGGLGVAVGFAVAWSGLLLPAMWYALRPVGATVGEVACYLGPPLVSAGLAAAGTWALLHVLPWAPKMVLARLAIGAATMAALYLGLSACLSRGAMGDASVVIRAALSRAATTAGNQTPVGDAGSDVQA